jgi:hypothetical protein
MPAGLNQIILTSIAKSPAERFQSADAFRNAVKIVLRDLQESKTLVQGSQDSTAAGSRTPLPHVRTGPITRPKTQTPVPVPVSAAPTASAAVTAATASRPARFTVAAPPPPAPAPPQPASNRGLFISLGAVVVLVVLVVAGLYIPRGKKASAADENTGGNRQPQVVTQQPVETKSAEEVPPEPPKKKSGGDRLSAGDAQAAAEAAAAARAKAAELDRVEHEIDQLTARAASVTGSVEGIQQQQAAMGVGLRGDVASHLASMKVNLAKAQDAIGSGDLERAKRYTGLADRDVEALEKFLGR